MQRTQEQLNELERKFKDECKSYYKLSDGTLIRETTDEIIQINENKTGIQLKFAEFEWYGRGGKHFDFSKFTPGDGVWVKIHYNLSGGWIKEIRKCGGNVFNKK